MSRILCAETLTELEEAFQLFDKENDNTVETKDLANVMRALGQNPTQKELQEKINEFDVDDSGALEFSDFVKVMMSTAKDIDIRREVKETFRYFTKGKKEFLTIAELQSGLASFGEGLTTEEIRDMMRQAGVDIEKEEICYKDFVKLVLGN